MKDMAQAFVTTQWAVCAVAMKVTEVRKTVLQPYLCARKERLNRAEQTTGD